MPHLLWSATTSTRRAAAISAPVGLGLDEVGRGQPGPLVDAVHAEDQGVDVQRPQRRDRNGSGKGVRRGAHAAGEDHGQVVAAGVVQQLGDARGVGDDGQVGDVAQLAGPRVVVRARGDRDRGAGLIIAAAVARRSPTSPPGPSRLDLEAGLVRAPPPDRGGAAVDLADQALARPAPRCRGAPSCRRRRVISTSSRHGEPPWRSDLVQDPLLPLMCEHDISPRLVGGNRSQRRTEHIQTYSSGPARRPRSRRARPVRRAPGAPPPGDLTQWRACPRLPPDPPASRASSPACSRRTTRSTSATTSARWCSWVGLQDDARRLLLRRRPARDHRRARPGACCASAPGARRPSTSPAASTRSGRTLFVQSHVAEHAAAGLGARLHHRLRRGRPDDPVQGQVGQAAPRAPPSACSPTRCCRPPTSCSTDADQRAGRRGPAPAPRADPRPGPAVQPPLRRDVRGARAATSSRRRAKIYGPAGPDREDEQVRRRRRRAHRPARRPEGHRQEDPLRRHRHRAARSASTRSDKPGVSNLLTIYSALSGRAVGRLEERLRRQGLRRPQEGPRRGRGRGRDAVPRAHARAAGRPRPSSTDILADGRRAGPRGRRCDTLARVYDRVGFAAPVAADRR